MRPIDFVIYDGGSTPNLPIHKWEEVAHKTITFRTISSDLEVLSYYYDEESGNMVVDLRECS